MAQPAPTDATMPDVPPAAPTPQPSTATTTTPSTAPSKKEKKRKAKPAAPPAPTPLTLRNPPWTYLHLTSHTSPTDPTPLDALTARTRLTAALQQFLGLTGAAISIDVLKLEGQDVWIRVPREDGGAVVAAVSGWVGGDEGRRVGWKVRGRDEWLGRLVGGSGEDLFGG
ncbi:hypothetical protein H2201_004454 [Coniosporium apollinis]|uniref:Ribonucleases P/MRP subunit Pop8-like domain-containing protein n=1 Tax=Coniosporium apollinis TaxID=61459 RepID=A0ABQ9NZ38_9PEZI|nr:hypothetical protein H2201_004454 [Coniosporium apollinis]